MLRNVGSNWTVTLMMIAATYVVTPFTIHALGQDGYGTWTLITAMTASTTSMGSPKNNSSTTTSGAVCHHDARSPVFSSGCSTGGVLTSADAA